LSRKIRKVEFSIPVLVGLLSTLASLLYSRVESDIGMNMTLRGFPFSWLRFTSLYLCPPHLLSIVGRCRTPGATTSVDGLLFAYNLLVYVAVAGILVQFYMKTRGHQ